MNKKYNYIIAGAGAAGLSLAWQMLQTPLSKKKVLIVDEDLSLKNNKTWCFWDRESPPFSDIIYQSWNKSEVSVFGDLYQQPLQKYTYYCLRNIDFKKKILKSISSHHYFDLLETPISHFSNSDKNAVLHSREKASYEAEFIFQSCMNPQYNKADNPQFPLIQHFWGWDINTRKPVFDKSIFTLMDFDQTFSDGIAFIYLLPWTKQSALVEYTVFSERLASKEFYEEKISLYLNNRFNLKPIDYHINRKEFGQIPMQDHPFLPWYNPRVMNIGTVGGVTKPSTGYTFRRIQKQAEKTVQDLLSSGKPQPHPLSKKRFRAYDLWLLQIIDQYPNDAQQVFHQLFKNNTLDEVFRFLAEESTLKQDLKIMGSVPYYPFLRAIVQTLNRFRHI